MNDSRKTALSLLDFLVFFSVRYAIFLVPAILFSGVESASAQSKPELRPLDSANRLFQSGKYLDAERAFRSLLDQSIDVPTRGKATFNLAVTLQKLGRYDEAIQNYNKLLTLSVDDKEAGGHLMEPYRNYRPRAQWEIGNCLFAKMNYAGAMQAY